MLSPVEKDEILQDARSARRKDAFRQARAGDSLTSLDAYLEFLNSVHKVFAHISIAPKLTRGYFKL